MALWDNVQGKWTGAVASDSLTDSSANLYHLPRWSSTNTPTAVAGHGGGVNLAQNLVPTCQFQIANSSAVNLQITGSITIAMWIKPNNVVSGTYYVLASKFGSSAGTYSYELQIGGSGKIGAYLSSNGTAYITSIGNTVIQAGKWYHIAFVYNGTDIRVYVNGNLDASPVAYTSGIYNCTSNFTVASRNGSFVYDGVVDDIAIWNRALSAAEIITLATMGDDFSGTVASLSGILKDKIGTAINCTTYPVWVCIFNKNNTASPPLWSFTLLTSDGSWVIPNLTNGTKYIVTFAFADIYAPTNDINISGAEFMTAA